MWRHDRRVDVFSVPEDLSNLSGWKISVILKDIQSTKDIVHEYGLSGTIVPPKERKEEKEKKNTNEKKT